MTMNEVAQTEIGLISRCKRVNEILGKTLALTIEITGQHYDDESKAGLDATDLTSDLSSWIQGLLLKADNLAIQLEYMKEQF